MKTDHIIIGTICGLMLLTAGCSKQEPPSTPPPTPAAKSTTEQLRTEAQNAVTNASAQIKETAQKAAAETKEAAAKVTNQLNSTGDVSAAQASTQSQGLIDRAKAYVADKKYEDALASLKQLSHTNLTPEQQKVVDNLKAQLQKIVSSNTLKSVGGLLQGK